MKAIVCESYGPPSQLTYKDIPSPTPGKDDVLIQIKACGVNFPDVLIIQGKYQFKPPLPFSPGSDVAGIVKAVGENVRRYKVGDEVIAMVPHGGFAEEVVAHKNTVFPKLPGMDFPVAASFLMAYGTSFHALKDRAKLQAGETMLVLGASGGVGLAAVELGKLMGARVIAAASTDDKLELCKTYGADAVINYTTEDLKARINELTDKKGVDVVYDPVGGPWSEIALRRMAWEGRFLVIGFAAGDIPKIPLNLPLLKGCAIVGVFWGAFAMRDPKANLANTQQLIQWFMEGKIKPHLHATYPLAEAPKALEEMMNRKVKGKVVIVM
ncbi:MAG: NADPH:quinone oxidoreductase family protein [Bacteroidetes bacterium]|nr:MAG: NADPH:quinone oxidoreductase family protein [Bacteroidota bacterium]